jgi:hypothetical protein
VAGATSIYDYTDYDAGRRVAERVAASVPSVARREKRTRSAKIAMTSAQMPPM